MMYKYLSALSIVLLANHVEARFGVGEAFGLQGKLSDCGLDSQSSGDLGGAGVGILLAAPDPCARYVHADKIVEAAKAQNKPGCIDVAREYTNAEKNFNPFASAGPAAGPRLCDDPNLPVSAELKGILPLIDPAVEGADAANQKATETLEQAKGGTALDNGGKSVQQQMLDIGFFSFFVGDTFPQPAGGAAAADANAPAPAANNVQAPAPAADANNAPAPDPAPAANGVQGGAASACFTTQFVTQGAETPCFTTQFVTATPATGTDPTPAPAANAPAPAADAPAPAPAASVETVFVTETFTPTQCQAAPTDAPAASSSQNSASSDAASDNTDGAAASSNTGATSNTGAADNAGTNENSGAAGGNQDAASQCFTTQFVTATPTSDSASACFTTQFVTASPAAGQAGAQTTPCTSTFFFTPTPSV